jgi:hypothetical protein
MSAVAPTSLSQPEFHGRIGVARRDATPPIGIYARAWGSALHDVAEGVHQPLFASCLVLQDLAGGNELVFLAIDLMVFWQEEAQRQRAAILSKLGLQPHQLMLHPSHTHSSPMLLRKHADREGGQYIAPYLDALPDLFCELVKEARANARPATLGWSYGKCAMAYNRDAIDATTNRDICGINTGVKADDTVLVGRITDEQGTTFATIVNYACHPVSLGGGNKLLSPDYIGTMREVVEREMGGVCVFFHGASGDTTPRRSYEPDVSAAEQNGRELGYAALAALSAMAPPGQRLEYRGIEESGTALGVWQRTPKSAVNTIIRGKLITTTLPIRDMPTREEIGKALAANPDRIEREKLERAQDRRTIVGDGTEGVFYFTVWQLGDAFMVATPGEPYSRFQVELRERFPGTTVAVLNATDGCLNYLPPPPTFARDVYQVRVALYAAGSMETVLELASDTIQQMR